MTDFRMRGVLMAQAALSEARGMCAPGVDYRAEAMSAIQRARAAYETMVTDRHDMLTSFAAAVDYIAAMQEPQDLPKPYGGGFA